MPRNLSGLKRGGPGRPKGVPNKAAQEIKDFARNLLTSDAYQKSLERRILNGTAQHMETLLHHYGYGKPKDTLAIENAPPVLVVDQLTPEDIQELKRQRAEQ